MIKPTALKKKDIIREPKVTLVNEMFFKAEWKDSYRNMKKDIVNILKK